MGLEILLQNYFRLFKRLGEHMLQRPLVPIGLVIYTIFQAVIMIWICQFTLIAKILYAKSGVVKIQYAKIPIDKIPYAESAICRNSNWQNTLEPSTVHLYTM